MREQSATGYHQPALYGAEQSRADPSLRILDPHKDEKMEAIHKALNECSVEHPVF